MIYRYLILAFLLTGILAGCRQEEEKAQDFRTPEIQLDARFQAMTKVSAAAFDEGDRIGVIVTEYTGDMAPALLPEGNYADNRLFTYTGGSLSTEKELYYPVVNNVDIYAYHPYRDSLGPVRELPLSVAVSQQEQAAYKAADFVWAKRTNVAANNSVVSLSFSHRMSKITVSVEAGTEVPDLTGMKIYIGGIACSGTVDLQTGTVRAADTAALCRVVPLPVDAIPSRHTYQAILLPQSVTAGTLLVEIELNGKKYSYRAPEGGQIFGSGKEQHYEFVVNAFQRGLLLQSASVTDWVSNGSNIAQQIVPDVDGREVLMALYNATGGTAWSTNVNWGSEEPLADWYGVTVADNEIIAIELPANHLVGTLPAELGKLPRLQRLVLNDNQLTDTLPASIGKVATLNQLNLARNGLTGKIPATFGDLRNLTLFSLKHNRLSGSIPRRVTLLQAYQADSIAMQLDDTGAEIMLETEGEEAIEGEKYVGDLNFTSQAEINTFAARGYSEILGNVKIDQSYNSAITNVPVFSGLKKIHGSLEGYNNTSFPDLAYVGGNLTGNDEYWTAENTDKLIYVGGNLSIRGTDVVGFNGLTEVNGLDLWVTTVNGFREITKISGNFKSYVEREQGFDKLTMVGGTIDMRIGESVPDFNNVRYAGELSIEGNIEGNFSGFSSLDSIGGGLSLYRINDVTGFENLKKVGGLFNISACGNVLPSFSNLKETGSFSIHSNFTVKLEGFNSLTKCGWFAINDNDYLTEINGFSELKETKNLELRGKSLERISGFEKLGICYEIIISGPLLTQISLFSSLTEIDHGKSIKISGTLLTDIPGFNSITSGNIILENNTKLLDISGFRKYKGNYLYGTSEKYSNISFDNNILLENISGFSVLTGLSYLTVSGCYSLVNLPLVDKLTTLSTLAVENNFSLTTIPAFKAGVSLERLSVSGNTVLEDYTSLRPVIGDNTTVTITNNKYNPTKEDILAGKVKPEVQ